MLPALPLTAPLAGPTRRRDEVVVGVVHLGLLAAVLSLALPWERLARAEAEVWVSGAQASSAGATRFTLVAAVVLVLSASGQAPRGRVPTWSAALAGGALGLAVLAGVLAPTDVHGNAWPGPGPLVALAAAAWLVAPGVVLTWWWSEGRRRGETRPEDVGRARMPSAPPTVVDELALLGSGLLLAAIALPWSSTSAGAAEWVDRALEQAGGAWLTAALVAGASAGLVLRLSPEPRRRLSSDASEPSSWEVLARTERDRRARTADLAALVAVAVLGVVVAMSWPTARSGVVADVGRGTGALVAGLGALAVAGSAVRRLRQRRVADGRTSYAAGSGRRGDDASASALVPPRAGAGAARRSAARRAPVLAGALVAPLLALVALVGLVVEGSTAEVRRAGPFRVVAHLPGGDAVPAVAPYAPNDAISSRAGIAAGPDSTFVFLDDLLVEVVDDVAVPVTRDDVTNLFDVDAAGAPLVALGGPFDGDHVVVLGADGTVATDWGPTSSVPEDATLSGTTLVDAVSRDLAPGHRLWRTTGPDATPVPLPGARVPGDPRNLEFDAGGTLLVVGDAHRSNVLGDRPAAQQVVRLDPEDDAPAPVLGGVLPRRCDVPSADPLRTGIRGVEDMTAADGTVWVAAETGDGDGGTVPRLYAVHDGRLDEVLGLQARLRGVDVGPDGRLWAVDQQGRVLVLDEPDLAREPVTSTQRGCEPSTGFGGLDAPVTAEPVGLEEPWLVPGTTDVLGYDGVDTLVVRRADGSERTVADVPRGSGRPRPAADGTIAWPGPGGVVVDVADGTRRTVPVAAEVLVAAASSSELVWAVEETDVGDTRLVRVVPGEGGREVTVAPVAAASVITALPGGVVVGRGQDRLVYVDADLDVVELPGWDLLGASATTAWVLGETGYHVVDLADGSSVGPDDEPGLALDAVRDEALVVVDAVRELDAAPSTIGEVLVFEEGGAVDDDGALVHVVDGIAFRVERDGSLEVLGGSLALDAPVTGPASEVHLDRREPVALVGDALALLGTDPTTGDAVLQQLVLPAAGGTT